MVKNFFLIKEGHLQTKHFTNHQEKNYKLETDHFFNFFKLKLKKIRN